MNCKQLDVCFESISKMVLVKSQSLIMHVTRSLVVVAA